MKAITLTQPWASLVMREEKRIETRSWGSKYRGPLAIHAAAAMPHDCQELVRTPPFAESLRGDPISRGCVLCIASVVDVQELLTSEDARYVVERYGAKREWDFGDYTRGRFAWILGPVTLVLTPPRHVRGALGLWEWEDAA